MPRVYNAAKLDDHMAVISVYFPIICISVVMKASCACSHESYRSAEGALGGARRLHLRSVTLFLIWLPPQPPAVLMGEERVDFPCADDALDCSYYYGNESLEVDSETADVDSG